MSPVPPRDALGDRLKRYEAAAEQLLPARLPVIVRLDGNSFSDFTRKAGFAKPFDARFERAMDAAALAVAQYCAGTVVGYLQSDEITLLLLNEQTPETEPFLANRTQKLASLTAARATSAFARALRAEGIDRDAEFDARVFVVPPAEVPLVFLWRQLDCFRNCVSSYAYWELGKKMGLRAAARMLEGVGTEARQELIFRELGVNVNDLPTHWRRGRCIYPVERRMTLAERLAPDVMARLVAQGHRSPEEEVVRRQWVVDREIPRFNQAPEFLDARLTQALGSRAAAPPVARQGARARRRAAGGSP